MDVLVNGPHPLKDLTSHVIATHRPWLVDLYLRHLEEIDATSSSPSKLLQDVINRIAHSIMGSKSSANPKAWLAGQVRLQFPACRVADKNLSNFLTHSGSFSEDFTPQAYFPKPIDEAILYMALMGCEEAPAFAAREQGQGDQGLDQPQCIEKTWGLVRSLVLRWVCASLS